MGGKGCAQGTSTGLGVGHGIYHGVWDVIFSFYVEHNPVTGSCKGVDFPFHVIRYCPRFTAK